ncbi:MAG: hypothetical protein R2867_00230 [Caldilineaceae bacterium]
MPCSLNIIQTTGKPDLEAIEDAYEQQVKGFFMDLDQACNNLNPAGAFVRKGKLYYFATPIFAEVLMESYNAKYLLRVK